MMRILKNDIVDTIFLLCAIAFFVLWVVSFPGEMACKAGGFLVLVVLKLIKDMIWQDRLVLLKEKFRVQLEKLLRGEMDIKDIDINA